MNDFQLDKSGGGMSASVSEVLNKAADLLEKPGAWTQGFYARSASGHPVAYTDDQAVCFCVCGAIRKVCAETGTSAWSVLESGDIPRPSWNDVHGRTQAEVVAALRAAASQAEGAA